MQKLKQRWGIRSNFQLVIIFIVFAINGSASAKIGIFLMNCIGWTKETLHPILFYTIACILILPLYPLLLMVVGWLFGQSEFFFKFGKKNAQPAQFRAAFSTTIYCKKITVKYAKFDAKI